MRGNVDLAAQRLDRLFVAHAESVFFVDNDEADVRKVSNVLQKSMRADNDVNCSGAHAGDDVLDLSGRLEAGEHFDTYWPVRKAVAEILTVLLCEQRRGN